MKVLVTGASGAIGRALVAALRAEHCEVLPACRHPAAGQGIPVDFSTVPSRSWWAQTLQGVDVVVNAVGIFREERTSRFDTVHTHASIELFHGCMAAGVRHVIQLSALGADEGAVTPFHVTKKAADDALRSMPIASTIVQPSLVYGVEVVSAKLFDRLAVLPWVALPRAGNSLVQPVLLEDVVEGLVALARVPASGSRTVAFVGRTPLSFREYLGLLRERQGISSRQRVFCVPESWALRGARLLEALPGSLVTADAMAMLLRGNTAPVEAFAGVLRHPPRALSSMRPDPGRHVHSMLSLWLPPLRWAVAWLWIMTGIVSLWLYPQSASLALLASVGVTGPLAWWALYGAGALDLVLGLAVFATSGRRRRWVWATQLAVMAGYTLVLSAEAPEWWLHPFGPLTKNLPLAALIGFLWAFEPAARPSKARASPGGAPWNIS